MVEFYNGDRSSRYPNDSDMVFDGIPFINAGDLVLGRVKLDTTNKITEEKYNQLSGAKIQCGDIIYCLRGTLGKNAFVDNFDIGTIASSLVDIRPQKIVGKYLFQVLNSDIEYSQRILNDEGAAQPNLSAKNLYLFDIPIPRDAEQIKIAEYLELLDHLITLHQSKSFGHILKVIISCTLSWEQRKLGEICQITMGQSPDGSTYSQIPSDYILVQGNADLKDGWVYPRIWTTQKTKMAEAGDLIMSVRAPAGTMGKTYYDVVIGRGVAGIKGSEFIYQALVKMDSNGYWKILASGSTFESINSDVVNGAELMVTENIDEQNKIGYYLASIDHLITLHQLEPFQLIFKAIAYRIIDYTKSKPPSHRK